jgi:SNF2 family DNA or RNA helicase
MCKTKALSGYAFGRDKLIPAFSSSDINVYPHQVASAMFALRSPFLPGVVLCDEGGLGKSYVALLIILQKWFAGRRRALFVIPAHLRAQWQRTLDEKISAPAMFLDSAAWNEALKNGQANPFEQEAIVVTTYEFAAQHAEEIAVIDWDVAMFDEAHRLSKCHEESAKEAQTLKRAVGGAFKILLTATPIQLNIMDLFGLIHFIDDTVFSDARLFYERYFRKPENYPELRRAPANTAFAPCAHR